MGVNAKIYAVTKKPVNNLRDLSCRLASSVGRDFFWIKEPDNHALSAATRTPQCLHDEDFVYEVNTFSRYYGPEYERGSWPLLYATMMWLSFNLDCKVYYGGDCDDELMLMGDKTMSDTWIHWCKYGGRPYYQRKEGPKCSFCADRPMSDCGRVGGKTIWHCLSCGKEVTQ